MYKPPIEITIVDKVLADIGEKTDNAIMMEITQQFGVDLDKHELVRALAYDRDQYDKGFEDGKKAMIQLLLENDICVCRLCESNGSPLDKFPCNKCKVAWPIFGDDYRFKLKE